MNDNDIVKYSFKIFKRSQKLINECEVIVIIYALSQCEQHLSLKINWLLNFSREK